MSVTEATLDECVDDALIAAQRVCNLPQESLAFVAESVQGGHRVPVRRQELLEAVGQMAGWLLRGEGPGDPADAAGQEADMNIADANSDGKTAMEVLSDRCLNGAGIAAVLVPRERRKRYDTQLLRKYNRMLAERPITNHELNEMLPSEMSLAQKDVAKVALSALHDWAAALGRYFSTLEHLVEAENQRASERSETAWPSDPDDDGRIELRKPMKAAPPKHKPPPPRSRPSVSAAPPSVVRSVESRAVQCDLKREIIQTEQSEREALQQEALATSQQAAESAEKALSAERIEHQKTKIALAEKSQMISELRQSLNTAESKETMTRIQLHDELRRVQEENQRLRIVLLEKEDTIVMTNDALSQAKSSAKEFQVELEVLKNNRNGTELELVAKHKLDLRQLEQHHTDELNAERRKLNNEWKLTVDEKNAELQSLTVKLNALRRQYDELRTEHAACAEKQRKSAPPPRAAPSPEPEPESEHAPVQHEDIKSSWEMGWTSRKTPQDQRKSEFAERLEKLKATKPNPVQMPFAGIPKKPTRIDPHDEEPEVEAVEPRRLKAAPPPSRSTIREPREVESLSKGEFQMSAHPLAGSDVIRKFIDAVSQPDAAVSKVELGRTMPWLRDVGLASVLDALRRYQREHLIVLDLQGCSRLGDGCVPALKEFLLDMPNVRHLAFDELNFSEGSILQLKSLLAERSEQRVIARVVDDIHSGNVMCLNLRNKGIHDDGVLVIVETIELQNQETTSDQSSAPNLLRTIDLRDNEITDIGAKALLSLLQLRPSSTSTSSIVTILLDGNPRVSAGVLDLVRKLSAVRKQNYLVSGDPMISSK